MKNKVDTIKELWKDDPELSDEELDEKFDLGFDMMEEIARSKDVESLPDLLELFTARNEEFGGVCERLENDIYENFTMEQIVYAIGKKFEYLIENNLDRLAGITIAVVNTGYFEMLRELLNKKRFVSTEIYIDALTKFKNHILDQKYADILREDMKKW